MPVNPIDPPISLDLKFREAPGGAIRKRATVPPKAANGQDASEQPSNPENAALPPGSLTPPENTAAAASMNLKFSTDETTGKLVMSVVDPNSGEVLRQVPSEEALKVAEQIGRYQGVLVDLKV